MIKAIGAALIAQVSPGEEQAIGIWLFLFYGVLALAIVGLVLAARSRRRRIKRIATEVKGRASVGYDGTDQIEFQVDGIRCALNFSGSVRYSAPITRLAFDWRPPGRLLVSPRGTGAGSPEPPDLLSIRTGEETFDSMLWARGAPQKWAQEVLSGGVRARLLSLSRLGLNTFQDPDVRFYAGPAGVRILCPRDLLEKGDLLKEFIRACIKVLREMRGPEQEPEILPGSAGTGAHGVCPVCSCQFGGELYACSRCAVPHHRACWEYLGGCGIFACRGRTRVTVVPGKTAPKQAGPR